MTEAELSKLWNEAKARIADANRPKQEVRKKALAVGVPWPESSQTEEISEAVAFEALKTANETVAQAETARAAALTSFHNTVGEKVALLEREMVYWQQGLELKVTEQKPKPLSEHESVVAHIARIAELVAIEEKVEPIISRVKNGPTMAVLGAFSDRISRDTGYYMAGLRMASRVFGKPWARNEARRLLTLLEPRLQDYYGTGYRTLLASEKTTESGAGFNTKEMTLVHAEIALMAGDLDRQGEDKELFGRILDYLRNDFEASFLHHRKVRLPEHRTLHSVLEKVRYCRAMFSFTGDNWYTGEAERYVKYARDELQYKVVDGTEYLAVTWRSRAMEPKVSLKTPEQSHMSVYALNDIGQIVSLATEGEKVFQDERLLRALANSLEAMLQPVEWLAKGGRTGKGDMYKDIGAFMGRRLNQRDKELPPFQAGDRMYKEGYWDDSLMKPAGAVLNYAAALILPWGSEGLRARYREMYGTPGAYQTNDPADVSTSVGFALAELYEAGLWGRFG